MISEVSHRASDALDRRAPEASGMAERAVERSGVEEKDTLAHIGLWSTATVLAGLASWSWRSLTAIVVVMFAASAGLELVQEALAPSRITEWSDVLANGVGIGVGTLIVLAVTSVSGAPARFRSRRRPRQEQHRRSDSPHPPRMV